MASGALRRTVGQRGAVDVVAVDLLGVLHGDARPQTPRLEGLHSIEDDGLPKGRDA